MPATPRPFDDIRALLAKMPKADEAGRAATRERDTQPVTSGASKWSIGPTGRTG